MKEKLRLDSRTGEFVPVLDDQGSELPDPVPMAPPVGFVREPPLHERIRAMVQHEYRRAAEAREVESEEEANDFRMPELDGDDPREGRFAVEPGFEDEWEEHYEPPADFREMRERLVAAGWTPPVEKGQGASSEQPPRPQGTAEKPLDASPPPDNRKEPGTGSGSRQR